MRSHRGDLRLSNPDWNEYELLGGIRWLRAMPGNPLGQETAGRDRITITTAKGDPAPIPPELLGAWWRAAERAPSEVASDYYRFQLLTGRRGVEIHGHKLHKYPPIRAGDVDHRAGRVLLRDTKNRSDHKLLLSRQALQIAKRNCAGRKADEPLFRVVDARKTLSWNQRGGGNEGQGHGLRATFASLAEELVSSALLKRMMNHAAAGDVTLGDGLLDVPADPGLGATLSQDRVQPFLWARRTDLSCEENAAWGC